MRNNKPGLSRIINHIFSIIIGICVCYPLFYLLAILGLPEFGYTGGGWYDAMYFIIVCISIVVVSNFLDFLWKRKTKRKTK